MNPLIQLKRTTLVLRFSVLLFGLPLLTVAVAEEEPQFSVGDYHRYKQENQWAECKAVTGVIAAVEPAPNGATIRLRAGSITETRKQRKIGEKSPHPKAETFPLYRLDNEHPPIIWTWDRKSAEEISFHWNSADGPPPLCRGMKPTIMLNSSGNVVDITFIAAITHWRKRKDGLVEVVLGYKDEGEGRLGICMCALRKSLGGPMSIGLENGER